jgi:hypothetical protein
MAENEGLVILPKNAGGNQCFAEMANITGYRPPKSVNF